MPVAEFLAYAEAQDRDTLAERLEALRPGIDNESKLRMQFEKAQASWLMGSVDSARAQFKQMTTLVDVADWRDSQREAIHYAFMRLAQSANSPTEREDWCKQAASAFPDLLPDSKVFPPPLVETYKDLRANVLASAKSYFPHRHFPEHRFLLINGKKYEIKPETALKIPTGTFRVTFLSDAHPPVSEKMTSSQMEVFRLSLNSLAGGTCSSPSGGDPLDSVGAISVLYAQNCLRDKSQRTLLSSGGGKSDIDHLSELVRGRDFMSESNFRPVGTAFGSQSSVNRRNWIWIGASIAAVGALYIAQNENSRQGEGQPLVTPIHTQGF